MSSYGRDVLSRRKVLFKTVCLCAKCTASREIIPVSADRKLALKLHPDKCSVPGADEAFKGGMSTFEWSL